MATATRERTNGNGSEIDLHEAESINRLPPNMMLMKMENESIMAVAKTTPRDPFKIVAQLQQLIDAYPAAADDAIYSKPVGTVIGVTCQACGVKYEVAKLDKDIHCPACDIELDPSKAKARKVKKFAEGLSIRAAESIRSIYGYTRLATTTEIIEDGKVRITGVLVDYAAGNITADERIVSPWYRSRGGRMEQTAEDRFLNVVVKAEKAKLRRDVILDNTPNIVKAMFRDACEKKLAELVSPELIEQKIVPAFAEYGVTVDHLEKIVGRSRKLGWREEERLELRKILTALKNEETTVRELLDGLDMPAPSGQPAGAPAKGQTNGNGSQAGGAVTGEHLANPKGSATAHPHEKTPAKPKETPKGEPESKGEPKPEPTVEREPGDEPEGDGRDSDAAEPEWYLRLQEEISECDGIRKLKEVGEKYYGKESPLSTTEKALAVKAIENAQEKIRESRGPRANKGQNEMFDG